jgi:hypothetical protein
MFIIPPANEEFLSLLPVFLHLIYSFGNALSSFQMENLWQLYCFFSISWNSLHFFSQKRTKAARFLLPPVRGGVTASGSRKAAAARSSLPGSAARRLGAFCPIIAKIPDYGLQNTA